jgi:excisionase family DNA binding protein
MAEKETIGVQEMARRLGVGEATIYRYIVKGLIPATRQRWGLRHRYEVPRADFERVEPSLMGLAGNDTIKGSIRKSGHGAMSLGTP